MNPKIMIRSNSKQISPLNSEVSPLQRSQSNQLNHCLSSSSFFSSNKKSRIPPAHFDSPYTLIAETPPSISFPKDKRFRSYSNSNNAQLCGRIWLKESPSNIFGNEKRKEVFPGNENPSPSDYKINTCFEDDYFHKKGYTISPRYSINKDKLNPPGPGTYNFNTPSWNKQYPISFSPKRFFFFHDMIKNRTNVSPQRYKINYEPSESKRFKAISLGIGERNSIYRNNIPGVGSYNLPSCFDMHRRTKYALN